MHNLKSSLFLIILLLGSEFTVAVSWGHEDQERGLQQASGLAPEQQKNYGAWLGFTMSRVLLKDSRAFIGRLEEVVAPEEQHPQAVDRRKLYYPRLTVAVEDWLYGDHQHYADTLKLEHVPVVRGLLYGSEHPGAVWRDVELNVGSRLLIFFYPKSSPSNETQETIDEYGLVVSAEPFFQAVKDMLDRHLQLAREPDQIQSAPNWLTEDKHGVLSGYLIGHFWSSAAQGHQDSTAIALSGLIGNSHLQESGWRMLERSLVRILADSDNPLSPGARAQVMRSLVNAGCSEDPGLAKSALRVLTLLGEAGHLDLTSFVTEGTQQRLRSNYQTLVQAEFEKGRRIPIEKQLGMRAR